MEASSFKIEKLRDKDNWLQWRFIIRTLLEEDDDMIDVCEGTLTRPAEDAEGRTVLLKKFLKADKAVRKLIVTTVEKKPLDLLLSCTTAREMWQKLNTVYDLKSDENLSMVQKQFFDFKWCESESVSHNISKLEQLSNKMKNLGSPVPNSMFLTRILSTLPRKFNHFHSAWDSVDETKKNLENLTARLMAEEMRCQSQEDSLEETVAMFAKQKFKNKNKEQHKQKPKQDVSCYNCGRPGHYKKDCYRCHICKKKGHVAKNCFKKNDNVKSENQSGMSAVSEQEEKVAFMANHGCSSDIWLIDSGASDHMTNRYEWFNTYESFKNAVHVRIGDGSSMTAYGKGEINIITNVNGEYIEGTLTDVLYVPKLKQNLFSVKYTAKKGIDFCITDNGKNCSFSKNNKIVAKGVDIGNLYKMDMHVTLPMACNLTEKAEPLQLWHERLCHQNNRYVKHFLRNLNINFIDSEIFCDGCAYRKQHRLRFHNKINRATQVREIIYTDVCGPMEIESLGGKRYFLMFKDDFSSFRKVYFIAKKSEVYEKLKSFCLEIENQFNKNIKEIHSDGGLEFKNKEVESFLKSRGIKHTINVPYTPEQNGVAERENRTIVETARSMIYSKSDLPKSLWAEAINTAVDVLNRTGPTKVVDKSPYELWFKEAPVFKNLKIFGTECFVHIPAEKRRKLDKKAAKGYFVGYIENNKGYRVYVPSLRDVTLSRDIIFKPETLAANTVDINYTKEYTKDIPVREDNIVYEKDESSHAEDNFINDNVNEAPNVRQLRDRNLIKRTDFYGIPITYLAESLPTNYMEAINSNKSKEWREAMEDEMNSLIENKTWILVEKPEKQKVINNRWVFTKKFNTDNTERFKARLVIKGYSQTEGIDYKETFSPVVRFDTVRLMLSITAREQLKLTQFDIKTAFLYGVLKEEIYMKQPEGFNDGTSRVCKLIKSLYGLKQAPRCWTEHFSSFVKSFGFQVTSADPCLYIYAKDDEKMLLIIYVDDGLLAATHEYLLDSFICKLNKEFKTTITKNVSSFLGVEICRLKDNCIFISQSKYIKDILEKFNLNEANSVSTPIEVGWDANDNSQECKAPYREAVGSLMYLQVVSRPDISFAVNVAARAVEKPREIHWSLIKRILRYLKGTADLGLLYNNTGDLKVYSDADFAGDKETRKSTSGMICMFANSSVIWHSKRQQCVSVSTTEAEYVSAASAVKEIIWLKKLFLECKIDISSYNLYVDNTSAIKLIKNPEFHQRSKHIDVKYHFIRDLYEKSELDVKYIKSEDQIADIFTKALPKPRFEELRNKLGLKRKAEIV